VQSTCPESVRACIQTPVLQKKKKKLLYSLNGISPAVMKNDEFLMHVMWLNLKESTCSMIPFICCKQSVVTHRSVGGEAGRRQREYDKGALEYF
jgi:hypothetical protein